ncbi:DNA glycosylase [Sulfuricaulis limicola]|uniref:Adenine DNA glycosylase n=1 Tax=Sulfuricaulis limicola TaxID=1620215 RepID=A0A1B4XCJ7_9GAMM|nr:A/G-specific adenine glycosylase [Sulfuricaulis limicola]BAV32506.1 DNA glycosylase [Sulfuricaulis limicola]
MSKASLSRRLLAWYDRHGRKTLPWKRKRDAYRIWVSEIMLQQTQVTTVIPYFERFIARFPNVQSLAQAKLDEVLHLWTGLGYYARARNLHQAAQRIVREHAGKFPRGFEAVTDLPGVGRSTAGAILALAFDQRHPILDGNVKRVLARYHAIDTPVNKRATEESLWQLAEKHTPRSRIADYTQAIMDLGATVCARAKPQCTGCPLRTDCRGHRSGTPQDFPVRAAKQKTPVKATHMLMIRDARGRVLLARRPPAGLWGGLWGFPECADGNVRQWCRKTLGLNICTESPWPMLRHSFSHFHLDITPIPARLVGGTDRAMENAETVWYNVRRPDRRGLSAPVKRLLEQLMSIEETN